MKRCSFIFVALLLILLPFSSDAQIPRTLSYQGVFTDTLGNPKPDGVYNLTFRIYETSTGGTPVWTEIKDLQVRRGLFSTALGDITPFDVGVQFDRPYWLAVEPSGQPELSPRIPLTSVGYSFSSLKSDTAQYAQFAISGTFLPLSGGIMTGAITNAGNPPITMGRGNFGAGNLNLGTQAFVAGANNRALGAYSVVSGGGGALAANSNTASGDWSTVGGGDGNTAGSVYATVGGGYHNAAIGGASTVGGGNGNTVSQDYTTVGGGFRNTASGPNTTVGGGADNTASGISATVGGGIRNTASDGGATVGGGVDNIANAFYATVGGGNFSLATNLNATVGGGFSNQASGTYATIPGGFENEATGSSSFAAGAFATAGHPGTFVWSNGVPFSSTGANQFLISAPGGVGIGTNSPTSYAGGQVLHINNPSGRSVLRLGDDEPIGIQWEISSAVFGGNGMLNFSNITNLINPLTLLANGNVGMNNVVAPIHPLHMGSSAHCTVGGVWTNASSRELKTDIEPLKNEEYSDILKKLEDLDVVHFKYKSEPEVEHIGMIAEDVPEEMASPDRKGIPTADAIAFLMAAVKAQQTQIEKLEYKIEQLTKEK